MINIGVFWEAITIVGYTFRNVLSAIFDVIIQIFPVVNKINSIPKEGLAMILGISPIFITIIIFAIKRLCK